MHWRGWGGRAGSSGRRLRVGVGRATRGAYGRHKRGGATGLGAAAVWAGRCTGALKTLHVQGVEEANPGLAFSNEKMPNITTTLYRGAGCPLNVSSFSRCQAIASLFRSLETNSGDVVFKGREIEKRTPRRRAARDAPHGPTLGDDNLTQPSSTTGARPWPGDPPATPPPLIGKTHQ